jgi:hypothetical protein
VPDAPIGRNEEGTPDLTTPLRVVNVLGIEEEAFIEIPDSVEGLARDIHAGSGHEVERALERFGAARVRKPCSEQSRPRGPPSVSAASNALDLVGLVLIEHT